MEIEIIMADYHDVVVHKGKRIGSMDERQSAGTKVNLRNDSKDWFY